MITDRALIFSDNQDLGSGTGATVSTDKADLNTTGRDLGTGKELWVVFTVGEAFAGVTAMDFEVVTDEDAALGSPTSVAKVTKAVADLTLGARFALAIPAGTDLERYLGCNYTRAGTASAGKISAALALDAPFWDAKPADRSL